MAKAILVMDMPESCSKCKFMYEFQGVKKCQLKNALTYSDPVLSRIEVSVKISSNCPLKPMPEKKMIEMVQEDYDGGYSHGFTHGFNACIDEICGKE